MRLERKQKRKILKSSPTLFFFFFWAVKGAQRKGKRRPLNKHIQQRFFHKVGKDERTIQWIWFIAKYFFLFGGARKGGETTLPKDLLLYVDGGEEIFGCLFLSPQSYIRRFPKDESHSPKKRWFHVSVNA